MQVPSEAIERHSTVCAFLERKIEADIGLNDRLRALATLAAEVAGEHAESPFLELYTCLEEACSRAAGIAAGGPLEPCQVRQTSFLSALCPRTAKRKRRRKHKARGYYIC